MKPLLLGVFLLAIAPLRAADKPSLADADAQTLKDTGIAADDEGLLEYLRGLAPSPEERREIKALIGHLGSDDFHRREEASRRLTALAGIARTELEEASRSKDLEVARRAGAVLADHEAGAAQREGVLLAVLREVARRKTRGAIPLLLDAPPVWERPRLRDAAEWALAAAGRPADAEALLRGLDSLHSHVRLAAALTLLNRGDRRALPVLGELLDSPDLIVRHRASRLLRAATGEEIDFAADDALAVRGKGAAAWRRWIERNGPAARLNLPVPSQTWLGKVLVVAAPEGRLVEFGEGGQKVWEINYPGPWCCRGLPDGHRLVGSNHPGRVDEYDAEGKLVWSLDVGGGVRSVQRLPGGNTLVAHSYKGIAVVREYRSDKTVCGEVILPDHPQDVYRLDGGNILAALDRSGRVMEVDPRGKTVWEVKDMKRPFSAQRIDNGNTLISEFEGGRVVEVDRSGKVIWSRPVPRATHAQRLPDGHTVISTGVKVFEIDVGGQVLWEQKVEVVPHLSAY
jgi:hypothetical protein